ncbi:MAG: polysaccharide biosynthesis tyrosine autokinase [Cohaesibacter sp.]|nr:polysaccharide biosynthesis tyrosine autokinase [Cohaesibacter sp.]
MVVHPDTSDKQFRQFHTVKSQKNDAIDFDYLIAVMQRQWRLVAVWMVIGMVLCIGYLVNATPLYTSTIRILYDQSQSRAVDELTSVSSVFEDQSEFESQMELIKSQRIASKVAEQHNLQLNDDFLREGQSALVAVISSAKKIFDISQWFNDKGLSEAELADRRKSAIDVLTDNVSVSRIKRTYILELAYTSESSTRAQHIASAFAQAYLTDQLDSKYDATRRASEWLQVRIEDLKQQSLAADLAVQRFKAENDLFDTGSGQNIAEAQLTGANAQLIAAKGEIARRKAEFDRLDLAIKSSQITAAVEASLDSQIVSDLRLKFLDVAKLHSQFLQKLGDKHIRVINLHKEMSEYQKLMFDELRRIRDGAKSKYEIALENEKTLRANLQNIVGQTADANKTQAQLRELEREAKTYKSLLENFLQKYQEAIQQQSFPVNDARIIQDANFPDAPSSPRKFMSLAISMILGAMLGSGIGAFREFRDRFFRTADQVREDLGLEFLGLAPKLELQAIGAHFVTKVQEGNPKAIRHTNGMSNYVRNQPFSSFAEALRGAKVAADITLEGHHAKVIAVVSSLPGEGKSTISSNLAQLLAMQGAPTLLIDGDMRNPGQTRAVARQADIGLVDILMGERSLDEALLYDTDIPLHMLPSVVKTRISHTSDLLASHAMQKLLMAVRQQYAYIVIDLPPIAPVVDVKAFAMQVDAFVYVVEWGKTSRSLVKTVMAETPQVREKCLGVILNKTEMDQMKLYQSYGSSDYYYSQYSSYYQEDGAYVRKASDQGESDRV